ncbi:winged helix-turn-helix domain-containing protein [Enterobacteriaceae bacterium H11S18]|uniref:winged helix-turn-helix domain-containing protein n=1 Tax=Dryocola clanedunensis TaxID=2925396 RepID=UPI0022F0A369|nr:winged helix-turn-helix domain-containing protein [Dryocola clanedunensis]MCT4709985.1 winged helix-turn-helix domain-containing protein [Dryocola clanedunensis]
MTYIINGIIKYKPEDGTLWNIDDPERVLTLTLTNSNLLQFILDSNGDVLSREAVLENIWDKQGLRSSNNTLNQYISISRRTLSLLGADEVIITVPRIGFCLNGNVKVVKEIDKTDRLSTSATSVNVAKEASGIKRGLLVLLFFLMLLVIFVLSYHRRSTSPHEERAETTLEQQNNENAVLTLCTPPGEKATTVVCKEYYAK